MPDHNRIGRRTSVSAVTVAIGACSLAISAWALQRDYEGFAVSYSTNALGMEFASVAAGQDWYDSKYYSKSPAADPKGPDSSDAGRGVRGGTFHDDGPWLTRVSLRMHFPEDYRHFDIGFRILREKR
jgi:formylglycine-generating enzyme required for sulfatase activity